MIIYKTTNIVNGKIYIGKDIKNDDNYIGSGTILKRAIKKYGINNFKKEIIETCLDLNHLNDREKYWIKQYNSINKNIGYNISTGGYGGDNFSHNPNKEDIRKKLIEVNKNKCVGMRHSNETKQKMKLNHADFSGEKNPFYGKKHNDKSIQIIKQIQMNRTWNDKISESIKEKIKKMTEDERRNYFSRNFNQNKSNEARRGIILKSKSDVIKEKFGCIILDLFKKQKGYSEISRIISENYNEKIGWWIIKAIINGKQSLR